MMDLIKQFAIDCAGQKEWDFPKDPKSYTFTPDEVAKFAELIVKECCQVLEQTQTALDRHKWPSPSECGVYIKEHFGVE